jgi:hypothetical protein
MKKLLTILFIFCSVILYGQRYDVNQGGTTTNIGGNTNISGELTYNYIHGVGSTDSINWSTGSVSNTYYKLAPTGADTLKPHEEDGVNFQGDSIKILSTGDYTIFCWLNLSTSGANDKIRVKLYVNNTAMAVNSIGRWIINSDGSGSASETKGYMWYKVGLAANSYLSIHVTNITGSRAIVLRDWKIFVEKKPE